MRRTVLVSFETPDRYHCIDVFVRQDRTFGIEQFRIDCDGPSRWQSLGLYGDLVFATGEEALEFAKQRVPWLNQGEVWRW